MRGMRRLLRWNICPCCRYVKAPQGFARPIGCVHRARPASTILHGAVREYIKVGALETHPTGCGWQTGTPVSRSLCITRTAPVAAPAHDSPVLLRPAVPDRLAAHHRWRIFAAPSTCVARTLPAYLAPCRPCRPAIPLHALPRRRPGPMCSHQCALEIMKISRIAWPSLR